MTLEQGWSVKTLKLGSENPCLDRQPPWPNRLCNRKRGHEGDHCHTAQAGDKVVEVWWPRGEKEAKA
jgi:hypothetical protein